MSAWQGSKREKADHVARKIATVCALTHQFLFCLLSVSDFVIIFFLFSFSFRFLFLDLFIFISFFIFFSFPTAVWLVFGGKLM